MDVQEKATIWNKIISTVLLVVPPFIAGNITSWAASMTSGEPPSKRAIFAMLVGSFGLTMLLHNICMWQGVSQRIEYIYIWIESTCATPLLRTLHKRKGEAMKAFIRHFLSYFMKSGLLKDNKKGD